MQAADKKRVIDAIAWRVFNSPNEMKQCVSLGQVRTVVARDFDLLGIKEFSAKYEKFIHKES